MMEQFPAMQSDRGRRSEGEEDGDEEWILAKFGDIEKKAKGVMCLHIFSPDGTWTDKIKYQALSKHSPIPIAKY